MVLKNLFRRKGRTLVVVIGIGIGVAAIVGLGALADGLEAGYNAMLTGSKSDLVLSQPDSLDITYSSVDQAVGEELASMSEVAAVSGMIQGFVQAEGLPLFFVFGYPEESFVLDRFQIVEGTGLDNRQAQGVRGKPAILGSAAAEALNKGVGDSLRLSDSLFRIVGIYQTGDGFEDSAATLSLPDAQELLGKTRQVSLFYIQLKDPSLGDRLAARVERLWPDLALSTTEDFADKQILSDIMQGYVWVIAGLAILIGGVGMMNAQLMSVFERTREIGVLRAVGWTSWRVLALILGESVVVSLAGGLLGLGLGWSALLAFEDVAKGFGADATSISPSLLLEAFVTVLCLGIIGGLYPAYRASRLEPVEALRYEGGSTGGNVQRLPFGGMAVQSLWQRKTRTALTLGAIGLTVGAIMALEGVIRGAAATITDMALGSDVEIMIRQADVADTSLSAIDERIGDKIAALPQVESVSGFIFSAIAMPETGGFFVIEGFAPNEYAIRRFNVVDGERITSNHQVLLGRMMAEAMNKRSGETIELAGSRFRVVGIFETGSGWEEMGGVITLRDAQALMGRPRKVTMYAVKSRDPSQAEALVEEINDRFPEVHAALAGEFVDQMPDMENTDAILGAISILTIAVGGLGVLNTMLMAVLERTREIGVLRAVGWRRRGVLGIILRESMLLGLLGGVGGVLIALGMTALLSLIPFVGSAIEPQWSWDVFARAFFVASLLGLLGGLYPAFRATRLRPIEALRYE